MTYEEAAAIPFGEIQPCIFLKKEISRADIKSLSMVLPVV
jgi:hypothetical protein